MAKKNYVQKLVDLLRPSNSSTDSTFRSRAKNFFDNVFWRSQTNRDATAVPSESLNPASPPAGAVARSTEKPLPGKLPPELWITILEYADRNHQTQLVSKKFYDVSDQAEINLWRQAQPRAENAKSNNNAVRATLVPIISNNPNLAVWDLDREFLDPMQNSYRLDRLENLAGALIHISNNPESDADTHNYVVAGLGGISQRKVDAPEAARIAAWGLLELANPPPDRESRESMQRAANRHLQSLSKNSKTCMKAVLTSKNQAKSTPVAPSTPLRQSANPPERRPTRQILLSALKRQAKRLKLVKDTLRRGR